MSMDLERELGKFKGDSEQAELARLGIAWSKSWRKLYGTFPPVTTPIDITQKPKDFLAEVILEYKSGPLSPELVNLTWQAVWRVWGKSIDHSFIVPSCDRTIEELASLESEGRGVILTPDEIYTQRGLVLLEKIFPKMGGWIEEYGKTGIKVENRVRSGGCIDIEMDPKIFGKPTESFYLDQQLIENIASKGKKGLRLATYIVGSQFSKLLTGRYFDQEYGIYLGLFGSSVNGNVVTAGFGSNGRLYLELTKKSIYWGLDTRSEGMK